MKLKLLHFLLFQLSMYYSYCQQNEVLENYFAPSISSLVIPVNAFEGFFSTSIGTSKYLPGAQIDRGYSIEKDFIVNNALQLNYGLLRNFNVGIEYNRTLIKSTFSEANRFVSDYSINNIGLRIRWRPIKGLESDDFTAHHFVHYTLDDYITNKEIAIGSTFIWSKRWSYNFITMLYYQIQTQPLVIHYTKKPIQNSIYALAGYAINSEFMIFSFINYSNILADVEWSQKYYQTDYNLGGGLGAQYRITRRLSASGYMNLSLKSKKTDSGFLSNISLRYFTQ